MRGWCRAGGRRSYRGWGGSRLCGLEGREGDPFGTAFKHHKSGIRDGPGGLEGEEAGQGDRAAGLILGVDVVVTRFAAHREQAWRELGSLASPDEASADR